MNIGKYWKFINWLQCKQDSLVLCAEICLQYCLRLNYFSMIPYIYNYTCIYRLHCFIMICQIHINHCDHIWCTHMTIQFVECQHDSVLRLTVWDFILCIVWKGNGNKPDWHWKWGISFCGSFSWKVIRQRRFISGQKYIFVASYHIAVFIALSLLLPIILLCLCYIICIAVSLRYLAVYCYILSLWTWDPL